MSEAKKIYNTTDPILLDALHAEENAVIAQPPRKRKNGETPHRGISRKNKDGLWRVEVGANGKNYNLGYYGTDHEATLARNYGESLIPGAKKVNNQIPPGTVAPEVQKKVAAEVVARLRGYGVLPSFERNGETASEVTDKPATPTASPPQPTVPETPEAQRERLVRETQDLANNSRKGK